MGPKGALGVWKCGQRGFENVNAAKHCGGEEVEPRAFLKQPFGDIPTAHVGGSAERGFEVAAAPIPGGQHQ